MDLYGGFWVDENGEMLPSGPEYSDNDHDRDQLEEVAENQGIGEEIGQILNLADGAGTGVWNSFTNWIEFDDLGLGGPCGEWTEEVWKGIQEAGLDEDDRFKVRPVTLYNDDPNWLEQNIPPFTTNQLQNAIEVSFGDQTWYIDNGWLGGSLNLLSFPGGDNVFSVDTANDYAGQIGDNTSTGGFSVFTIPIR